MAGYLNNSDCIMSYLELFQALGAEQVETERCRTLWREIRSREQLSEKAGVTLASVYITRQLQLEERDLLLMMAALSLEMDGALRNGFRRRYGLTLPTLEYGLQLIAPLCPSSCETLAELARWNVLCSLLLTTTELTGYPLERPLILSRNVLAFLTGMTTADIPGCVPLLEEPDKQHFLPLHEAAVQQAKEWYDSGAEQLIYLSGPRGAGCRTVLHRACGKVVCLDLTLLSERSVLDLEQTVREAAVLALLTDAAICVTPDEEQHTLRFVMQMSRPCHIPLAILARTDSDLAEPWETIRLTKHLSSAELRQAWRRLVPNADIASIPDGILTIGALQDIASRSIRIAAQRGGAKVERSDVREALRQRGGAMSFGIRYEMDTNMDDMVLASGILEQLELICQSAQSGQKLSEWGLPNRRSGVTAVFHGPSGTGKTMAAAAIATRLKMPLLRADLSQIMDKYVGETEKHLGRLFQSARENHCVLLFDEADALFGKRASVSTGHDKFANLSTSYLLQEIEQYEGVALLSTNLLSNFDDAFLRRLQYIVRFSLPDAALREELWRRTLPVERCVESLPYAELAQAELSPARINAAAQSAAVMALMDGESKASIRHIVKALRFEMEKNSKALPKSLAEYIKGVPEWTMKT